MSIASPINYLFSFIKDKDITPDPQPISKKEISFLICFNAKSTKISVSYLGIRTGYSTYIFKFLKCHFLIIYYIGSFLSLF